MRTGAKNLWRVVYVPHSQQMMEAVERMLTEEGILVRRQMLHWSVSGAEMFELCVLDSEAQEARQLILEHGY